MIFLVYSFTILFLFRLSKSFPYKEIFLDLNKIVIAGLALVRLHYIMIYKVYKSNHIGKMYSF